MGVVVNKCTVCLGTARGERRGRVGDWRRDFLVDREIQDEAQRAMSEGIIKMEKPTHTRSLPAAWLASPLGSLYVGRTD